MVKPLSFKGDKVSKRKRSGKTGSSKSSSRSHPRPSGEDEIPVEDDTSWATPELGTDLEGPVTILFSHPSISRPKPNDRSLESEHADRIRRSRHHPDGGDDDEDTEPQIAVAEPSKTMSFVSADAAGSVFALPVINVIGSDGHTSEPDDVRQVWTILRPAGRSSGQVGFKSAEGFYLSSDRDGVVSARSVAIGPEEVWDLVPVGGKHGSVDESSSSSTAPGLSETGIKPSTDNITFALRNRRRQFLRIEWHDQVHKLVVTASKRVTGANSSTTTTADDADSTVPPDRCLAVIRMQNRFLRPQIAARTAHQSGRVETNYTTTYTRLELEKMTGLTLTDGEIKALRSALRKGTYREALLDLKSKKKHDKFA